ncbi:modification methylase [Vibrio parahaemolyticus]|uniref:Eco57I restriction-modification methylase domain-containing protein n=2 Tax=Vibrio parahaemolyticus TaxID=670 RepID=UPI001122AE81|nr:Eco57I restriction-modification methylase domain-containing protein [Vibrio parahaemolyticus]EIZ9932609.1 Eco57I restriction-modification methylase domain-containing protein [Vibrio parahaemolyticus]MBE4367064.1 modification methylase [Vibrio parahaemolyticus]TOJ80548.1 modification methylase [Vibrio parahaemolyticus]TOJ93942.1 modification methylase [Vibrio parahaemolyticus]HCE2206109.1 Eco57I restriction-modification methylase domain-containing protein [Vibrio parahaemolyticus]
MTELAIELPLNLNDIADVNRLEANGQIDEKLRGKLGQFMSSSAVSVLLASMFEKLEGEHRLLDAGAGVGSLTAAFVQRAQSHSTKIESTCFELSSLMNHYLADTLQNCASSCESSGVEWVQTVVEDDFIEQAVSLLEASSFKPKFNKAILNPPYLKISAKGPERKALRKVNFETGNLYSAFVGLAIKLLEDGGELVAITPRSFCNGPYFNDFRKLILDNCSINQIHVFNSRNSAFKTDKVLQENVVFHLTKGEKQRDTVIVRSSNCAEEPEPYVYEVPFDKVVSSSNPDRFIHIITNEDEENVATLAGGLPCSLEDLGIQASTGKVVDFRTRDNLSQEFVEGSVPLIFPQHLQNCGIVWPIENSKKPNALLSNESTSNLMVKNGTYVLTRRLTAKEETRRIVASIYSANLADVDVVGFENKTNYFHANGEPLDESVAKGLWLFLNSTLVDKYFRQMNGHTQVNATDLRTLRYPTNEQLIAMGNMIDFDDFNQTSVDEILSHFVA